MNQSLSTLVHCVLLPEEINVKTVVFVNRLYRKF